MKDGRKAVIDNSGFGTVFGVVDGKPLPVCDYAGFAPFGVGYRRCPGEQLTIQVFEDFLRKVWKSGIEFHKLDIANPEPLPIGPTTVIADNVGFSRWIAGSISGRVADRRSQASSVRMFETRNQTVSTDRALHRLRGAAVATVGLTVMPKAAESCSGCRQGWCGEARGSRRGG